MTSDRNANVVGEMIPPSSMNFVGAGTLKRSAEISFGILSVWADYKERTGFLMSDVG